jgi:hypothetical protein
MELKQNADEGMTPTRGVRCPVVTARTITNDDKAEIVANDGPDDATR